MRARSRILDQLSLAHKSGRVDDAWARIRTWEPLREGILSPSPLTGLGYPRAAAQRPRSVKPFPCRLRPGGHQPRLFPVGLLRGGSGASMVQYFTKAFFDELAGRLNADAEWGKKAAAIVAKIVLTCTDRNASFLLDIQNGRVAVHDVARRLRGLQDRRDLRGLDATRIRGEGLSRTRTRRANMITRLHAAD